MRRTTNLALTTALLTATMLTAAAPDADARGRWYDGVRVGLKGSFGFGGEAEIEQGGFYGNQDYDLEPTAGFTLFGTYPLWRYIHVGLNFGVHFWEAEIAENYNLDPNAMIDIEPFVKGRIPFLKDRGEVYAIIPIGLSISSPSDDFEKQTGAETGVGVSFGLLLGASYELWEGLGAFLEVGWTGRHHKHELAGGWYGEGGDASITWHQFALNFGAQWTF